MAESILPLEQLRDAGSTRFTVREPDGSQEEILLIADQGEIVAWKNVCQHETDQRLDVGRGPVIRDGTIVCPRHGSLFDMQTGACERGMAAGTQLVPVEVAVRDGIVMLVDETLEFLHLGGIEDDEGPTSTSHLL